MGNFPPLSRDSPIRPLSTAGPTGFSSSISHSPGLRFARTTMVFTVPTRLPIFLRLPTQGVDRRTWPSRSLTQTHFSETSLLLSSTPLEVPIPAPSTGDSHSSSGATSSTRSTAKAHRPAPAPSGPIKRSQLLDAAFSVARVQYCLILVVLSWR